MVKIIKRFKNKTQLKINKKHIRKTYYTQTKLITKNKKHIITHILQTI